MLSRFTLKTHSLLRTACRQCHLIARPGNSARQQSCLAERRRHCSRGLLEDRKLCSPPLRAHLASAGAQGKDSLVLGIESSCDDTGVAVVRTSDGAILGQAVTGQVDIHAPWGGVVPKLAQEAHERAMDSTVEAALREAGISQEQLEGVAVTIGPGLSLCLQVGVQKARQIAAQHGLKYIPVHHMEAHALIARAGTAVQFPYLCLLVSGGHNMIVIVEGVGAYTLLGSTLDDAVGEAYDKIARLLGLELNPSGGAAVEALAREGDAQRFKFSRPLLRKPNCNFSYAGLKTAVRLAIEAEVPGPPSEANRQVRADIAASFQRVALEHLEDRVSRAATWALEDWPGIKHLVVAGGVAANQLLRSKLQAVAEQKGLELAVPPPKLCTDNGVMVAWAGIERMRLGLWEHLPAHAATPDEAEWVDVRPRWPLTDRRDNRSLSEPRSERKKRLYTSLTELTQQALQAIDGNGVGQQNGTTCAAPQQGSSVLDNLQAESKSKTVVG